MMARPSVVLVVSFWGGGGDGSSTSTTPQTSNPASTTAAIQSVPLAGELVADCTSTGVGLVDSIIDAVNAIGGSSLPPAPPKLSDVLALADPSQGPVLRGIIVDAANQLTTISADDIAA